MTSWLGGGRERPAEGCLWQDGVASNAHSHRPLPKQLYAPASPTPARLCPCFPLCTIMSFTRQPPSSPRSSRPSYPALPLEHTPSSSSSIPSLSSSEESSSPESEALASPLRRLSLREKVDSLPGTRKPQVDSPFGSPGRGMTIDAFGETTREKTFSQERNQDQRSMHREADTNIHRGELSHTVVLAFSSGSSVFCLGIWPNGPAAERITSEDGCIPIMQRAPT